MSSRAWVKINCDKWFDGSIRKEPLEVRAIWADIIALAGRTGYDGNISLPGINIGYSDDQFCSIFNVQMDVWLRAKERLAHHPDGEEENRIRVSPQNCIEIINWKHYQSEYSRQRSYRQKLQPEVTTGSYSASSNEQCGEKEKEKENRSLRSKSKSLVRSSSPKRTTYSDGFLEFWSHYPKQVGKQVAFESWNRLLKGGYPDSDMIRAAREYAKTRIGEEEKFTLHPSTFLNKGRWKDFCFEEEASHG